MPLATVLELLLCYLRKGCSFWRAQPLARGEGGELSLGAFLLFLLFTHDAFLLQVFSCRLVDLDLALAYCTLLPQKDVFENLWKLIDKAWQNYDKILVCPEHGSLLLLTF